MDAPGSAPSMPALLRAARARYRDAIRRELARAGFTDVPGNGIHVIGAIARSPRPMAALVAGLGVSRQAAGQLVETLVARGYVERSIDPDDRRRLRVALTGRGRAAAGAIRAGIQAVDAELAGRLPAAAIAQARATLAVLARPGQVADLPPGGGSGSLRTVEMKAFVPARDFAASLAFYRQLGFEVPSEDEGLAYVRFGETAFLLRRHEAPARVGEVMMHLLVADADAWHAHVLASGVVERFGASLSAPEDRPWRIRDFTLVDPAGVLWRIGHNL